MNFRRITPALAALPLCLGLGAVAQASSHREAPLIAEDPSADNTDLYAWVTPGTHDKLYIVANFIPLEEPSAGPLPQVLGRRALRDPHHPGQPEPGGRGHLLLPLRHQPRPAGRRVGPGRAGGRGQGVLLPAERASSRPTRVFKVAGGHKERIARDVPVAPTNIGPRTFGLLRAPGSGSTEYDDAYAATFITSMGGEGRVWAGPRDDGFYVDLGGCLRPRQPAPQGHRAGRRVGLQHPQHRAGDPHQHPHRQLPAPRQHPGDATTLGIWAAASRRQVSVLQNNGQKTSAGPWRRVSRLGLPLVNEALIGLQDKDKYNRSHPQRDVQNFGAYFLNPVVVRDAEAVGIYAALGVDPTPFKSNRTDIIDVINLKDIPSANAHDIPLSATGDVLRVDLAADSGFPNGRPIPGGARPDQEQADVTDVLLSLILAGLQLPISDGVDYNDKPFLSEMPFLPLPHRGYDQGHGTPTP
ncbi:MAG: DUF4331 domain-containing protein [Deltaproteobacteria bacterium]|nr:DUF4331 domain-containing protein [Deltaproteobacteria bacterium]